MNEVEPSHDEGEGEDEVHFREDDPQPVGTTPPTPITSNDMDVIIKGWEIKFEQISICLRDVQLASEKANSDMFSISREGRAREDEFAARIRTPGITTTSGTHAPGITTPFGTHAPEITTTFGTRAPEITTTSGTRASESTTTLGTRAPETFTTIEIGSGTTDSTNDLHMKTIGEIHTIME